ncbi:MAG: efflux RND transporter periplasmic adaptor subunit [Alphaproteobacteria bacterium]|nr:efflux RND transporter periplasmic adaptor subunit [Alphaproteobacteria bacterium]
MKKTMFIMLALTGLLFGGIFSYQAFKVYMTKQYMKGNIPPIVVSALGASFESWQPEITATGTLRAINGVDVTTEIAGLVKSIHFTSGKDAQAGDLLVELNVDDEIAQLHSLEAQAELAQITYGRDKEQFAVQGVSKATLDTDEANLKSARAQVAQQAATIAKKIIRAPFPGRLGISAVNLGQYLNPGDKVVTLQSLDPLYVDFYLPQQQLPGIAVNLLVTFTTDAYPNMVFKGKITSINPKVDPTTRNVEVEATLSNPDKKILPGMFGNVSLKTGTAQPYLTLPQTAISYNPYGDLVYILKEQGKDQKGNVLYVATQKFVTVGDTRGDQVQVLKGLEKGDLVVTAGQNKLKNGSIVIINNTVVPRNDPHSNLKNE